MKQDKKEVTVIYRDYNGNEYREICRNKTVKEAKEKSENIHKRWGFYTEVRSGNHTIKRNTSDLVKEYEKTENQMIKLDKSMWKKQTPEKEEKFYELIKKQQKIRDKQEKIQFEHDVEKGLLGPY